MSDTAVKNQPGESGMGGLKRWDPSAQQVSKTDAGLHVYFFFKEKSERAQIVVLYVCMYVWSSHIAEYGSTG